LDHDLPVPPAWRDSAEEIRAHLCALRGGAPFLSPADALALVQWLEQGVDVADILRALERAARSRRDNNSRLPLSLVHARRHLGRPTRGAFHRAQVVPDAAQPLAPVIRALQLSPSSPARDRLVVALRAIEPGSADEVVRAGLAAVRTFFDERWGELSRGERRALSDEARASLGDLIDMVEPHVAEELLEEATRDALRSGYPALTAASLWEVAAARGVDGP
jgi:hypothetical protein